MERDKELLNADYLREGYAGLGSFEAIVSLSPQKTEAIAEPEVAR